MMIEINVSVFFVPPPLDLVSLFDGTNAQLHFCLDFNTFQKDFERKNHKCSLMKCIIVRVELFEVENFEFFSKRQLSP